MSEPKFFQTRMGQRFYEHTAPELVRQLEQLNKLLERLVTAQELREKEKELSGVIVAASCISFFCPLLVGMNVVAILSSCSKPTA